MRNEDARVISEEFYQNPLAAYSTQQLREELSRRHRVKLKLFHKYKDSIKQKGREFFKILFICLIVIISWEIGKLIF